MMLQIICLYHLVLIVFLQGIRYDEIRGGTCNKGYGLGDTGCGTA